MIRISLNLKILFFSILLSSFFFLTLNLFQENLENFFTAQITQPLKEIVFVRLPAKKEKIKLDLEAKSVLSIKIQKNGREKILLEKDSQKILPIASLSKLMTAVILLENSYPQFWQKEIIISQTAAQQENVNTYGNLKKGEKWKVQDLFKLMLIYSSNDAALALAEIFDKENFVLMMNQKAQELGLFNSHFVNPTGLDPENISFSPENYLFFNYSTAQDLFKLAKYILKNHPLIFEVSLENGPYLVKKGITNISLKRNQRLIGGKTGYTLEAGGSILLVLENERGEKIINIILATPSKEMRSTEMEKLIREIK